jgi:hypothetical protein
MNIITSVVDIERLVSAQIDTLMYLSFDGVSLVEGRLSDSVEALRGLHNLQKTTLDGEPGQDGIDVKSRDRYSLR